MTVIDPLRSVAVWSINACFAAIDIIQTWSSNAYYLGLH